MLESGLSAGPQMSRPDLGWVFDWVLRATATGPDRTCSLAAMQAWIAGLP